MSVRKEALVQPRVSEVSGSTQKRVIYMKRMSILKLKMMPSMRSCVEEVLNCLKLGRKFMPSCDKEKMLIQC